MAFVHTRSDLLRAAVLILVIFIQLMTFGCASEGNIVRITTVENGQYSGIDAVEMAQLSEIKKTRDTNKNQDIGIETVIQETPNHTVSEYIKIYPESAGTEAMEYRVGVNDIIEITVYEEPDLSRQNIRINADGYVSFPFIGRIKVAGLTVSEIEHAITTALSEGQYIHDAHVSVTVSEFLSKTVMVLGSVKNPGSFSLQSGERVLDAISKAGGMADDASNQGILVRTIRPNSNDPTKHVIWIDLIRLLNEGNPIENLLLNDKDLLYIPRTEHFYIIGQVQNPGSYPYMSRKISLIEAISMAGSFTPLAAPNKTRILRVENGVETIIEVKVNAITEAGKKGQDVLIKPGDVIIVPESLF